MQTIKEKLHDMSEMRKAKAEAKEEEKAEKEVAKARVEVAHEVRMAREAEAAMDLHVNKAAEKAAEHGRKHQHSPNIYTDQETTVGQDPYAAYGHDTTGIDNAGTGYTSGGNMSGGPPTNNLL